MCVLEYRLKWFPRFLWKILAKGLSSYSPFLDGPKIKFFKSSTVSLLKCSMKYDLLINLISGALSKFFSILTHLCTLHYQLSLIFFKDRINREYSFVDFLIILLLIIFVSKHISIKCIYPFCLGPNVLFYLLLFQLLYLFLRAVRVYNQFITKFGQWLNSFSSDQKFFFQIWISHIAGNLFSFPQIFNHAFPFYLPSKSPICLPWIHPSC